MIPSPLGAPECGIRGIRVIKSRIVDLRDESTGGVMGAAEAEESRTGRDW